MALKKLEFNIERSIIMGVHTSVLLRQNEDPMDALREEILHHLELEIEVTIGDVTAPIAFWLDPDHWGSDWVDKQGPDFDPTTHILEHVGDYEH